MTMTAAEQGERELQLQVGSSFGGVVVHHGGKITPLVDDTQDDDFTPGMVYRLEEDQMLPEVQRAHAVTEIIPRAAKLPVPRYTLERRQ